MICDYPKIYKGELLSSYIYRYHYYAGYKSYRDTAYEIWGNPNKWITSIVFPSDTIAIRKQLRLSDEEYVKYHTVFPFFKIFMPEDEWKKVKYEIIQGKRMFQKNQLEEFKRSYVNTSFRFCPACIKANNNLLIIKREHQIQGAFSCSTHDCKLETYNFHDRRQRIQFDRMKLFKEAHNNNSKCYQILQMISHLYWIMRLK